jgi:hypothetical protein
MNKKDNTLFIVYRRNETGIPACGWQGRQVNPDLLTNGFFLYKA